MQFYLSGTTPLFWKQIGALPAGVYDKSNDQTSSANIAQLFVAFVDKPVGQVMSIWLNGMQVATAAVLNDVGLLYARIPLPYTRAQDSLQIEIKDSVGNIIQSSSVSTSHIDLFFEAQAAAMTQTYRATAQLEQDTNIQQVEDSLLEDKFGVFTGVEKRFDQSQDGYRAQTSCLWRAYGKAATEQGLVDAIRCIVGSGVALTLTPTRQVIGNKLFDVGQFDSSFTRTDVDHPHYYMANLPAKYRTSFSGTDSPNYMLFSGPPPPPGSPNPNWDTTNVKAFSFRTRQAIGNEIVVSIGATITDATVLIANETIRRQAFTQSPTDKISNEYIASAVTILTPAGPFTEGADYNISRLNGTITWVTANRPVDDSDYTISYRFRLDEALKIVAGRVKPAHRKVILTFATPITGLPLVIIA